MARYDASPELEDRDVDIDVPSVSLRSALDDLRAALDGTEKAAAKVHERLAPVTVKADEENELARVGRTLPGPVSPLTSNVLDLVHIVEELNWRLGRIARQVDL